MSSFERRAPKQKVNKDRSQKQGIPGARTRAEAASILIKERKENRQGGKNESD